MVLTCELEREHHMHRRLLALATISACALGMAGCFGLERGFRRFLQCRCDGQG